MAKNIMQNQASANISSKELEGLVRQRAQQICAKRGCAPGNDWQDWFEAEKQIKQELKLR